MAKNNNNNNNNNKHYSNNIIIPQGLQNVRDDHAVEPILFIHFGEDGKALITKEASKLLNSIDDDVSVICVAGPYRTGKSLLLNRIIGKQSAFALGSTINSCTKGIWLWGEPMKYIDGNGRSKTILFLDTEGLGDVEKDEDHDIRTFTLSVLLSSTFIYNNMGTIDSRSLNDLSLILNISQMLRSAEDEEINFVEHFPDFVWIIRDFCLELKNKSGNRISPDEYLENSLDASISASARRNEANANEIKNQIRKCFKRRKCYVLVRPVEQEGDLQRMEQLDYVQLRSEFRQELERMIHEVLSTAKVKSIKYPGKNRDGVANVTGKGLLSLAENYILSFNNGDVPHMDHAYVSMCRRECETAMQQSITSYVSSMGDMFTSNEPPFDSDTVMNMHSQSLSISLQLFQHRAKGDAEIFSEYMKKTLKAIVQNGSDAHGNLVPVGGEFFRFYRQNFDLSYSLCTKLADDILVELKDSVQRKDVTSADQFQQKCDALKSKYQSLARGPAKGEKYSYLCSNIENNKSYFATLLQLDDLEQRNLATAMQLEKVSAKAMELEDQRREDERNHTAQLEALNASLAEEQKRSQQQIDDIKQQQEIAVVKLREEHALMLQRNQEEMRIQNEAQLQKINQENDQKIGLLQNQFQKQMEVHKKKMKHHKKALAAAQEAANRAAQDAAQARASASRGGGGGCVIS